MDDDYDDDSEETIDLICKILNNQGRNMEDENRKDIAKALRQMSKLEYPYEYFKYVPPMVLEIWSLAAFYLDGKV